MSEEHLSIPKAPMADFLIHVHRKGSPPFRTLSALPDEQAVEIMRDLFVEGSVFWERFKDPRGYLALRRKVERNLREGFLAKGGRPADSHPVYLILGRPKWMDLAADEATLQTTDTLEIPLSVIPPDAVSFTYPDSMVSALLAERKPPEYYEPEYHGRVFTLKEIADIVRKRGMPGEGWETKMPPQDPHFIEAQVWDRRPLVEYYRHTQSRA
jgi:hypothetical protein